MTVKCEAMVEAGATEGFESNQALANDASSAMTIEFLRARLQSERAASKAARQQAQQIAERVKELQTRLDMEIKHRKEAEVAMDKVFTVLRAKGLAVDDLALATAETKEGRTERGISTLDSIKEKVEDSEEVHACIKACPAIDEEMPLKSSDCRNESTGKGMTEHETCGSDEPGIGKGETETHIDVENSAENQHGNRNTSPYKAHVSDDHGVGKGETTKHLDMENSVGHYDQVQDDRVQHAVTSNSVVQTHQSGPECAAETEHRQAIELKLKAMLHQIEKEVDGLPKEQPLKLQIQSWVDHVVNMLNEGKEASVNGGLELLGLHDSNKADTTHSVHGPIYSESKILTRNEGKVNAEDSRIAETGLSSVNQMQALAEEVDTKGVSDISLSIVPNDKLQGKKSASAEYPSTLYPPMGIDAMLRATTLHKRQPSRDSLKGGNRASFGLIDAPRMPWHPEMVQYGMSYTTSHPPMFVGKGHPHFDYTGAEWPYLVEAQSPRNSDAFSIEDLGGKVGQAPEQWRGPWPQTRVSGLDRPGGLGPKEMLSGRAVIDGLEYDASNELYMKPDTTSAGTAFVDYRNVEFERGYAYHPSTAYMGQGRDPMEFNIKSTRHPRGHLNEATLSLMDDKNGRLQDILMALHIAQRHVNDDKEQLHYAEDRLVGPPTPTVADAGLYRGYHRDEMQHVPYEHHHPWRSRARSSQAPIIHLPPSPSSEHGYPAFERHGGHRRSSSVSTDFMMPGWETHLQPRGEVQLGNGITLYTD